VGIPFDSSSPSLIRSYNMSCRGEAFRRLPLSFYGISVFFFPLHPFFFSCSPGRILLPFLAALIWNCGRPTNSGLPSGKFLLFPSSWLRYPRYNMLFLRGRHVTLSPLLCGMTMHPVSSGNLITFPKLLHCWFFLCFFSELAEDALSAMLAWATCESGFLVQGAYFPTLAPCTLVGFRSRTLTQVKFFKIRYVSHVSLLVKLADEMFHGAPTNFLPLVM